MNTLEVKIRQLIVTHLPAEDKMKSFTIEHLRQRTYRGKFQVEGEIRMEGESKNRKFEVEF